MFAARRKRVNPPTRPSPSTHPTVVPAARGERSPRDERRQDVPLSVQVERVEVRGHPTDGHHREAQSPVRPGAPADRPTFLKTKPWASSVKSTHEAA